MHIYELISLWWLIENDNNINAHMKVQCLLLYYLNDFTINKINKFCQIFDRLFIICVKLLIKSKVQQLSLNHRPSNRERERLNIETHYILSQPWKKFVN